MPRRILAFGVDLVLGAALVIVLLFAQETFRTKRAFDKKVHIELSDTGIPQWFRYALDSYKEKEFEPSLFIKGIEQEKQYAYPIILFAPWLIFTLFFALSGTSPGKWITGLRVQSESGAKASLGRISVRYFGKWLSAIPVLAGFIMAFFTPRHQALHDKMNRTVVVRRQP